MPVKVSKNYSNTAGMTGAAIIIDAVRQLAVQGAIAVGSSLMLVIVMAEVLRAGIGLMLAIASRQRPRKLEGQENKQEDGKPGTHGGGL